jgi:hypothetical protein
MKVFGMGFQVTREWQVVMSFTEPEYMQGLSLGFQYGYLVHCFHLATAFELSRYSSFLPHINFSEQESAA